MNSKSYKIIFIVLYVFILGVLTFTYINQRVEQDGPLLEAPAKAAGSVTVGVTIAVLAYFTKFFYYLLFIQQAHHNLVLFQNGRSSYESFYQPIFEEIIKFTIVAWYQQAKYDRVLKPIELCLVWCGFTLPSLTIYFYDPQRYSQKYDKFLMYYQAWLNQMRSVIPKTDEECRRLTQIWSDLVTENIDVETHDKERRRSTISSDKSHTSSRRLKTKISSKMLPNEFNIKEDTARVFPKVASSPNMDVPPRNRGEYTPPNESYSKAIQKLYSVSPKDTYHLIKAVAIATFDDNEEDEDEEQLERGKVVGIERTSSETNPYQFFPDVEDVFENIDDSFDDEQSMTAGENLLPNECRLEINPQNLLPIEGASKVVNGKAISFERPQTGCEISTSGNSTSLRSRMLLFINWWSWLFPPLLPVCGTSQIKDAGSSYLIPSTSNLQFVNERFPLLKSKLSNYNLNSTKVEYVTYSDPKRSRGKPISRAYEFQAFLSYYFDISLYPLAQPFAVDRWFLKYGELLTETSPIWIFLDELNIVVWQLFIFQTIGLYLSNLSFGNLVAFLLPIVMIKLFAMNYLQSYDKRLDFRIVIALESVACTLLFCGVLLLGRINKSI
ncbi:hypothetical protein CANMA_001728 [Candida margitis]|uniref:uncharacterized protein n=1 Tax=Candida margitis TaxID=1775924 RepID=UPI002226A8BB|nr:uncharacterized protein CANMA_001728 [Candida margitis]KAI5969281.1 hypothetical protein CANMA_001728 [Candida margitis]